MKISERTVKILKNFSGINQSIMIRKGNSLSTISEGGNMLGEAKIEEEFVTQFGIYDLNEFLNTLKLFSTPVLDFRNAENNYLYICEEDDLDFKVQYTFANEAHITYPKRKPDMGEGVVSFELSKDTLNVISKSANVMQLPNMIVKYHDDSHVSLEVSDIKNSSSNKFTMLVEALTVPESEKFNLIFMMETFKLIPEDYIVSISKEYGASFISDTIDYYIGLNPTSRM